MKNSYTLILLLSVLLFTSANSQTRPGTVMKKSDPVILYGSGRNEKAYVPPPKGFVFNATKGSEKTADIIVDYQGFTPEAKTAFEFAVQIWESLIVSEVPIYMQAKWENLGSGVLGATYYMYGNLGIGIGGLKPYAFYPVALAEKMIRKEITGETQPDIFASFNSAQKSWYYGTDGNTPDNKYDMVSVVLHEIAHGLGFIGSLGVSGDNGYYDVFGNGLGLTEVFDHYIEDKTGNSLIDTLVYGNPSGELKNAITGNKLYFSGPVVLHETGGSRVKLYAPSVYNPGSSVYHLDENTYNGTENALMTFQIGYEEVIHNPGPITLSMMADWGWIHTYIDHEPLKDREEFSSSVTVLADISSDTIFYPDSIYLVYSYDSLLTADSIKMLPSGEGNIYEADIPVDRTDRAISYYITTKDYFGRIYTAPSGVPEFYYRFYMGADTIKPVIDHKAVTSVFIENTDTIELRAKVTDNIGLDSVYIVYRINNTEQEPLMMDIDSADEYYAYMLLDQGIITNNDTIYYNIIAVDSSSNNNISASPDTGSHKILILGLEEAQTEYENDFNQPGGDFLMYGFSQTSPEGFEDDALHTIHPYEYTGENEKTIEYYALLRIPIILKQSDSYMSFDEIVLVEPATAGSHYGDDDFWDYVIVEGSNNKGKSWHKFEDGYDSGTESSWNTLFYKKTDADGNSLSVPSPGNYLSRIINLHAGVFSAGDTVLIRFRLFSDALVNGWGWAIDNLEIQGDVPGNTDNPLSRVSLSVYPNPTKADLQIELSNIPGSVKDLSISVYDMLGRERLSINAGSGSTVMQAINIKHLPDGIYLLKIQSGNFYRLHKVLKTR